MSSVGGTVPQQGLTAASAIKPFDLVFSLNTQAPNARDFSGTNQADRLLRPLLDVADGSVAKFDAIYTAVSGEPIPVQMGDYAIVRLAEVPVVAGNILAGSQVENGAAVKVDPSSVLYQMGLLVALEAGQPGDLIWAYRIEAFYVDSPS